MKIAHSTMALNAQHSYRETQSTSLQIQTERRSAPARAPEPPPSRPEVSISDAGKTQATQASEIEEAVKNDPKMRLIMQLVEFLTGRPFQLNGMSLDDPNQGTTESVASDKATQATPVAVPQEGTAIRYQSVYEERESMQFNASGIIRTEDGREISFEVELSMSRSFREEINFSAATGSLARAATDPLVLNFGGSAATLSNETFAFDLNSDGKTENISKLNAGSAYLVIDRNGDGKINDGKELFGTQSGDGFADLGQLDGDRNGWIDENDAAFAILKLWIKDASGNDKLLDLKSAGIGALFLGKAKGDFSLNNPDNQQLGRTRATGIYLREDGGTGTLQQVDLVA